METVTGLNITLIQVSDIVAHEITHGLTENTAGLFINMNQEH